MKLWETLADIKANCEFVELNHDVDPNTPHFFMFDPITAETKFTIKDHGFEVHEFKVVSQYGTHVDAPNHFHPGAAALNTFTPDQMINPLCVIDCVDKVKENIDYAITVEDIQAWEAVNGEVPAGAFVAFRTDWSKREDLHNADETGTPRRPGWSVEAIQWLVENRNIAAIGHETADTDPGALGAGNGYAAEKYILGTGRFQIELLKNLDKVPATGALIVTTWPKLGLEATGFTARVFAIVEK